MITLRRERTLRIPTFLSRVGWRGHGNNETEVYFKVCQGRGGGGNGFWIWFLSCLAWMLPIHIHRQSWLLLCQPKSGTNSDALLWIVTDVAGQMQTPFLSAAAVDCWTGCFLFSHSVNQRPGLRWAQESFFFQLCVFFKLRLISTYGAKCCGEPEDSPFHRSPL